MQTNKQTNKLTHALALRIPLICTHHRPYYIYEWRNFRSFWAYFKHSTSACTNRMHELRTWVLLLNRRYSHHFCNRRMCTWMRCRVVCSIAVEWYYCIKDLKSKIEKRSEIREGEKTLGGSMGAKSNYLNIYKLLSMWMMYRAILLLLFLHPNPFSLNFSASSVDCLNNSCLPSTLLLSLCLFLSMCMRMVSTASSPCVLSLPFTARCFDYQWCNGVRLPMPATISLQLQPELVAHLWISFLFSVSVFLFPLVLLLVGDSLLRQIRMNLRMFWNFPCRCVCDRSWESIHVGCMRSHVGKLLDGSGDDGSGSGSGNGQHIWSHLF